VLSHAAYALLTFVMPLLAAAALEPAAEPIRVALGRGVRRRRLWARLLAASSCTFLDELVVALAALRTEREQAVPEAWASSAPVASRWARSSAPS
jgi:hypothetical protein